jgi:hypothetical protein
MRKRFVGLEPVQRESVLVAVDGDGVKPKFRGGAKNTNGDFSTGWRREFSSWSQTRK